MRVLITGGAGFIGSRTCALLVAAGHEVKILDCLDPQIHGENASFPASVPASVLKLKGSVCNLDDCMSALQDVDAVIHLAARTGVGQSMYDVADYFDTNVRGTATLVEAIVKSRPRSSVWFFLLRGQFMEKACIRVTSMGRFTPTLGARVIWKQGILQFSARPAGLRQTRYRPMSNATRDLCPLTRSPRSTRRTLSCGRSRSSTYRS